MHVRRIVVGVDFTDASLAAARWAAWDFAPDAELVLVHVAPVPWVPSFARAHLKAAAQLTDALGSGLRGALRGLAELVDPHRARVEVVTGNPAEALALVADELGADAICVGRGSRRRGGARFGATTPQRLLARTRLATLIVPVGPPATPAHAVVGVDERAGGTCVLNVASRLATAFGASVDVLHVIDPELEDFVSTWGDLIDSPAWESESLAQRAHGDVGSDAHGSWLRERARDWLHALVDEAAASVQQVMTVIRFGDAGSEIIRQARESAADLIIIGRGGDATRTYAPTDVLPVGSTARLVTWAAPCPVLVLPVQGSLGAAPPPPERESGQRAEADVIPLRSLRGGIGGQTPPAARRGHAGAEGCGA